MKQTYRYFYKFPALRLGTAKLNEFMLNNSIPAEYNVVDKSSLFGIEVEVENLPDAPGASPFWALTDDGSLRNYGREYISRPIRGTQIEYALKLLFGRLKAYDYKFTPRCSIHVHCNARTMTPAQLHNMMLIYLIFEKVLFKFVGQDREKNIHCVPIGDSSILNRLSDIIFARASPGDWMKYTAVNLVPLNEKGTIEFRHMHGTDDIGKIMAWINIILKMKLYAYKTDVEQVKNEIFQLNSNSLYRQFAVKVFGEYANALVDGIQYSDFSTFMEDGVVKAKKSFATNDYLTSLKFSPTSVLSKLLGVGVSKKKSARALFADSTFLDMMAPYHVESGTTNPTSVEF